MAAEKARWSPLQEVMEMHFQGSITGCTESRHDQFFNARADRHNLSPHNKKCWAGFQEQKKTMHRI